MAITIHEFAALKYFSTLQKLGRVATLGRQRVALENHDVASLWPGIDASALVDSETLLKIVFHAKEVESLDISSFEGATRIVDLSAPSKIFEEYDTVIDFGTSEHVFDVAQCFRNIINMTKINGQIIHALPANNFYGHGFWQVCADLYLSLYSSENGFAETEIFMVDYKQKRHWYKLKPIKAYDRHEAFQNSLTGLIVRTKKVAHIETLKVYQTDYVTHWSRDEKSLNFTEPRVARSLRAFIKKLPFTLKMYVYLKNSIEHFKLKFRHENKRFTKIYIRALFNS